jgi:hypothetical protein
MKNQIKLNIRNMKKLFTISILTFCSIYGYTQTQMIDSLKEVIEKHEGKLNALDERVLVSEADLGKLNKLKISGYVQAQWELYGKDLVKPFDPNNTFLIRRARVKFTYEPLDGVKLVLQPDFSTGNIALQDAYGVVSIPKLKEWSIWAGQFDRPNYEVEYSSSQVEVLDRSRVIRTLYPKEKEIGAKLEYKGSDVPLKFQFMALNGNFAGKEAKDVDSRKDLMGRLVYELNLRERGIGLNFGVNGYLGGNRAKTNPYVLTSYGVTDSLVVGDYLSKKWLGGEFQLFADFLGGMSIKGEYLAGVNSLASTISSSSTTAQKKADPNKLKNFSGFYLYLIKNIGSKNQFIARYDFFDPNTKLSGDAAVNDIYYKTLSLAWQYYLNDWIRLSIYYDMPKNEVNSTYKTQIKDNILALRVQAKF